jgi:DNA-binding transcriptional ArsR family regulator
MLQVNYILEKKGNFTLRELNHPKTEDLTLYSILFALGDPIRLNIVSCLWGKDESCCNSFDVPVAKNTMTYHFRVLREAGIIWVKCIGTKRILSLRKDDLEKKFPGLLESVLNNYKI